MLDICKNIKRFRLYMKMTQKELAEWLDVSPKTVSKWETGLSAPDISHVAPLAQIFGVSTDELLLPADKGVEETEAEWLARRVKYAFPKVIEYGVSFQTIAEAAGVDENAVENAIVDGEISKSVVDKAKAEKLGNILSFLDSLIFTMLECPEIIVSNLISKLRDYNCVGEEVIEKYASLQTGMLRAFMDKRVTLNTKQFVALVATLFLLDNTLNRETPFPWE